MFPWGTFIVNITGSALVGLLAGMSSGHAVEAAVGLGFCGALTTSSTFSFETLRLLDDRAYVHAFANVTASIVGGIGAVLLGFAVGEAIIG